MSDAQRCFSPTVQAVIDDLIPICRKLAEGRGRYAIAIGGSQGKGMTDIRSVVDFRLFHEQDLPWLDKNPQLWAAYIEAENRWRGQGIFIDGVRARKIGVETAPARVSAEIEAGRAAQAPGVGSLLAPGLSLREQSPARRRGFSGRLDLQAGALDR
jgi:hypothetical protein